ncbi:MAG TPA: hypothetical protein VL282_18040 [Tepidisphaeraceae bacterium]|jgi:hypothetical protein|nr:hypothetical protein [Tepidisphaeraceae bacterium]
MLPTQQQCLERIHESLRDLRNNGIDLFAADDMVLQHEVTTHLDYLQSMLGYDASVDELIELIKTQRWANVPVEKTLHA